MKKKILISIGVFIFILCFVAAKIAVSASQREPNTTMILMAAQENSGKGRFFRWYLKNMIHIDWNRPNEYGALYLNTLVGICREWTLACAETANILLSQKADINASDSQPMGLSPIHAALTNQGALEFLVDHGRQPQSASRQWKAQRLYPYPTRRNLHHAPHRIHRVPPL